MGYSTYTLPRNSNSTKHMALKHLWISSMWLTFSTKIGALEKISANKSYIASKALMLKNYNTYII